MLLLPLALEQRLLLLVRVWAVGSWWGDCGRGGCWCRRWRCQRMTPRRG